MVNFSKFEYSIPLEWVQEPALFSILPDKLSQFGGIQKIRHRGRPTSVPFIIPSVLDQSATPLTR